MFGKSKYNSICSRRTETNTEQEIKQKNVGSGESIDNNCALNSIDTILAATVACPVTSGLLTATDAVE
jgi:hypothetical protein